MAAAVEQASQGANAAAAESTRPRSIGMASRSWAPPPSAEYLEWHGHTLFRG